MIAAFLPMVPISTIGQLSLQHLRRLPHYIHTTPSLSAHSSIPSRLPATDEDHQLVQAAHNFVKAHESAANHHSQTSWSDVELLRKRKSVDLIKSIVDEWQRLSKLASELQLISTTDPDPDMRQIALAELEGLCSLSLTEPPQKPSGLSSIRSRLLEALFPHPPSHHQSALVEIKPGVGGVEAAHFATSLMNLYTRYGLRQKWRVRPVNVEWMVSGQGMDGLREATLEIEGQEVYGRMRWEAGVHRVQRVPVMQNTSAVHTSTAAVLPLDSQDQNSSGDALFEEKDVRMETMRSQGAGGQHVNKTESAVRLTHVPTGIVVSMQDSRSQHQNRARAFMILRARLSDLKNQQKQVQERDMRLSQVKTSDRNQKIRTYNFQQGRVTDHRIGLTLPRLHDLMDGGETLESIWKQLAQSELEQSIKGLLECSAER